VEKEIKIRGEFMTNRRKFLFSAIVLLFVGYVKADTWTTLPDCPFAVNTTPASQFYTKAQGISGTSIVGSYYDNSHKQHGFLYNAATQNWSSIGYPGASDTRVYGISGSSIVGEYVDISGTHGFIYNGTSYTPMNYPGAVSTDAYGISGSNIAGLYIYNGGIYGFLYNGESWATLPSYPGATFAVPQGISGNNIVGYYVDGREHGFLYNGTSYTALNYPGALDTSTQGISGSSIVGWYNPVNEIGTHSFLYSVDTQNWIKIAYPGAVGTLAYGIDGSSIVGFYFDSSNVAHNFLYTIPEPATLLLFAFGGLALRRKR
jgi:hypothetical protein